VPELGGNRTERITAGEKGEHAKRNEDRKGLFFNGDIVGGDRYIPY